MIGRGGFSLMAETHRHADTRDLGNVKCKLVSREASHGPSLLWRLQTQENQTWAKQTRVFWEYPQLTLALGPCLVFVAKNDKSGQHKNVNYSDGNLYLAVSVTFSSHLTNVGTLCRTRAMEATSHRDTGNIYIPASGKWIWGDIYLPGVWGILLTRVWHTVYGNVNVGRL